MKHTISAIILTHNSAETIEKCLESLKWCNSRIVLDDFSSDETLEKVSRFEAAIYRRALQNDFAAQRNFSLTKASTEWVFFVDADEVVTPELAVEIQKNISRTKYSGFFIPRTTFWDGKKVRFGEFFRFSLLRLGKRESGKWEGTVHEHWVINGKVGRLSSPLLHSQIGGIGVFLKKINFYSSIRAQELFKERKKTDFFEILFFPISKFFFIFIIKLGFVDSIPGLINALGMSFYTFLVRAKLWLLWNETKKKNSK